jgi:hypothetical protein
MDRPPEVAGGQPHATSAAAAAAATEAEAAAVVQNGAANCSGKWEVDTFLAGVPTGEPFNFVIP